MRDLWDEDLLEFATEHTESAPPSADEMPPWNILIVDDDEEVHIITRLVLRDYVLDGRPARLFHAYSAQEAKALLSSESGIAVILLDVVMETDDAGLRLVRWIRDDLQNRLVRIILRTGQPGVAPEKQVITEYEINDYKSKTEITDIKLYTAITVALRGYRDLRSIQEHTRGFGHIIRSARSVLRHRNLNEFFSQAMEEAALLAGIDHEDWNTAPGVRGICLRAVDRGYMVVAVRGGYEVESGTRLPPDLSALNHPATAEIIAQVQGKPGIVFTDSEFCAHFQSQNGEYKTTLLIAAPGPLTHLDKELLHVFTSHIEVSYENLSLGQSIETSQREIIYTLGEVVESRSQETGNHVRRVGALAELLATLAGMDETQRSAMRLAAPMHDIGKIGIPDSILNKPGALTEEEREIIQSHAEIGYSILRSGKKGILQLAAELAYTHHERWDGSGYPRGLAGQSIPLSGRIVAIADVFDALTHTRVYKKTWTMEDALDYISQNGGTQFDPELARRFVQSREEIKRIFNKYEEG